MLFSAVVTALENGGKPVQVTTTLGYTKEQAEAIQRLMSAKDNYDRLGLQPGATRLGPCFAQCTATLSLYLKVM